MQLYLCSVFCTVDKRQRIAQGMRQLKQDNEEELMYTRTKCSKDHTLEVLLRGGEKRESESEQETLNFKSLNLSTQQTASLLPLAS